MKRLLFLPFLALAVCRLSAQTPASPAPAPSVSPAEAKAKDDAQTAALAWLKLADSANYVDCWQAAAEPFKKAVTLTHWVSAIQGVRPAFGDVLSREVKTATFTRTLPGAPDGEYVVIVYNTVFANKKKALETITPMHDPDGTWKVSGYFIN